MALKEDVKQLVSEHGVSKCIECGECTSACPVSSIKKDFSPRRMANMALLRTEEEGRDLVEGRDIWTCTTCGICNSVCPYSVDFVDFIQGLREMASIEDQSPNISPCLGVFLTRRIKNGSTGDRKRMKWITDDLDVKKEGDVYYFSGCTPFFDLAYTDRKNLELIDIPRNAVGILNSVGVTPAINEDEKCCGHDLLWMGEKEKAKELAKANIEAIKESGADTIVFTCPEGLRTFREDYEDLLNEKLDLNFLHLSEYLQDKEIPLREKWEKENITYHDACRFKHLDLYEEPRDLLEKIPNVDLNEMKRSKEKSSCCGVNAMATCGPIAEEIEKEKLIEAKETGADKLVVPCSKCLIHLNCRADSDPSIENGLDVVEFTNFVAEHLIPK